MPLLCVFYAEFDNRAAAKIRHQYPADIIPPQYFATISEYIITRRIISNQIVTLRTPYQVFYKHSIEFSQSKNHQIQHPQDFSNHFLSFFGFPVQLNHPNYHRNAIYFNCVFAYHESPNDLLSPNQIINICQNTYKINRELVFHELLALSASKSNLTPDHSSLWSKLSAQVFTPILYPFKTLILPFTTVSGIPALPAPPSANRVYWILGIDIPITPQLEKNPLYPYMKFFNGKFTIYELIQLFDQQTIANFLFVFKEYLRQVVLPHVENSILSYPQNDNLFFVP